MNDGLFLTSSYILEIYNDNNQIDNNIMLVQKPNIKIINNNIYLFIQMNRQINDIIDIVKNNRLKKKIKLSGL